MTLNDEVLPDGNISPRGKARYILSYADNRSRVDHMSGAALAGYAVSKEFTIPDGVGLDEFAEIGDEVIGDGE